MKILIVNKFGPQHPLGGGAEKRLEEVFTRIGEDHDVHLVTGTYEDARRTEQYNNITIHRFPLARGAVLTHLVLFILLPFYALRIQPDVIYEDISVAPWLAHLTCFWIPHTAIVHNFNGTQFLQHGKPRGVLFWLLDTTTLLLYKNQTMITVSAYMEETLAHHGFTDTHVIHNGVEQDLFDVQEDTRDHVLYLGRLAYRKGTDLLFDAWHTLRDDIDLHVAGANHGNYTIPEDVTYHGYVTEEEKRKLLGRTRAVLIPSRWEGYGIVALEAAATGTPVVANDAPGLREAVTNETGELVNFNNVTAVTDAISSVAESYDPTTARRYAEGFKWETTAERTKKVIEEGTC